MKTNPISMTVPVAITAAAAEGEEKSGPATFEATFYTGGALSINGWDEPVVVDLAGLQSGNVLVANLDHDPSKRVGNFTVTNDGKSLVAHGTASAATPARDEVVNSAVNGYVWQASLEVQPHKGGVELLKSGKTATVNGQVIAGPAYITRRGTLKGFAFVSHGADDNTTASIAAIAANNKEKSMTTEVKQWIEAMGLDVESLSADQLTKLEANYNGRQAKPEPTKVKLDDALAAKAKEVERTDAITEIALKACDRRPYDIESIKLLANTAIEEKWTVEKFRLELLEATVPPADGPFIRAGKDKSLTNRVIEAALCSAGRLSTLEKDFTDQELQVAHDRFRHGIGLKELFVLGAEANGYRTSGYNVDINVQRAAFGMANPFSRPVYGGGGFSTIDVANIVAATANKFLHEGWMAVDLTPLRIAAIRPVRNFQQITTVSLTGHLQYEKLGAAGEIKHGTLDDLTYTNQADTYAAMLAITRKDIINDDLGALTAVPRRLGRGGALKLNDIFWTEFLGLVSANFFASGNSNLNAAVADMTIGGLAATETIFMNQTDPDGKPLGIMPKIVLVPTALKATATALLDAQRGSGVLITGASTTIPDANVFQGRFRVESSPYISNSSYTGNTSAGWWMLADPNECPVIEIAALNGKVEPTVETADADFNVLGVQMRGYSDIGVNEQEYRGGVYADGGSS